MEEKDNFEAGPVGRLPQVETLHPDILPPEHDESVREKSRYRPTVSEVNELKARVESLLHSEMNSSGRIAALNREIVGLKEQIDRCRAQIRKLESLDSVAAARENDYWEKQWRNEAAAREWAESQYLKMKNAHSGN